jgi:hypothetical protein
VPEQALAATLYLTSRSSSPTTATTPRGKCGSRISSFPASREFGIHNMLNFEGSPPRHLGIRPTLRLHLDDHWATQLSRSYIWHFDNTLKSIHKCAVKPVGLGRYSPLCTRVVALKFANSLARTSCYSGQPECTLLKDANSSFTIRGQLRSERITLRTHDQPQSRKCLRKSRAHWITVHLKTSS